MLAVHVWIRRSVSSIQHHENQTADRQPEASSGNTDGKQITPEFLAAQVGELPGQVHLLPAEDERVPKTKAGQRAGEPQAKGLCFEEVPRHGRKDETSQSCHRQGFEEKRVRGEYLVPGQDSHSVFAALSLPNSVVQSLHVSLHPLFVSRLGSPLDSVHEKLQKRPVSAKPNAEPAAEGDSVALVVQQEL